MTPHDPKGENPDIKAGYLVLRMKAGWGVMIDGDIEIRINTIKSQYEVELAVRAPKQYLIRKLK